MTPEELKRKTIIAQQREALRKVGFEFADEETEVVDPATGKLVKVQASVLKKASQSASDALAVLTREEHPFKNYPGVAELRRQFEEELARIPGCTGCARGALLKKYLPRAIMLLDSYKKPHGKNNNPGTQQVSASGGESQGGASWCKKLLRRAATGVAKVFRAGKAAGQ